MPLFEEINFRFHQGKKREMTFQHRNLLKGSAVQMLNQISSEYIIRKPTYEIECLGECVQIPPCGVKCSIMKDNCEYVHIGESASNKEEAEQNAAKKILEIISNYYIFSDEKIGENLVDEE